MFFRFFFLGFFEFFFSSFFLQFFFCVFFKKIDNYFFLMDLDKKLLKEQVFLQNLKEVSRLDEILTEISDNCNQGLTDLAYLRFKNENLGYSLTATSLSETPAKRFLLISPIDSSLKLEINSENSWHLQENEENSQENIEDFELNSTEKTGFFEQELKDMSLNEQILTKFGIANRDPLVYHAQNAFVKSLEKLIELHNLYRKLDVFTIKNDLNSSIN